MLFRSMGSKNFSPGEHQIEITVVTPQSTATFYHMIYCASEPVVTLIDCPATTQAQSLTITVKVRDDFAYISNVWINDKAISVIKNQSEVTVTATIFLSEGRNTVEIKALSSKKGLSEKTVTIYREPQTKKTATITINDVIYGDNKVTLCGAAFGGDYIMAGGKIVYLNDDGSWSITLADSPDTVVITLYSGGVKVSQIQQMVR